MELSLHELVRFQTHKVETFLGSGAFEAVTATHLTILYVRNEVLAVAYALVHMSGSMLLGRMTQMIM